MRPHELPTRPGNTIRLTTLQHGETQNLRARSVDYLNEKQCYYHSSSKSFFSLRIPIRCRPRRTPCMQQAQLTNGRSRRPPNSMLVTPSQNYPKQCAPRPTDKKTIDNKSKGSITGTPLGNYNWSKGIPIDNCLTLKKSQGLTATGAFLMDKAGCTTPS